MLSFTPLPADHPINNDGSPLDAWNSDLLIKTYLARLEEPQEGADYTLLHDRLQMFRARMIELDALRCTISPRKSSDIDRELAGIMYKRKLLLWMTFPILDLPNEILTTIFRYVVWSSAGADQATKHRLYLTWVCRRFRDVALLDQTLWNSVWFRDAFPWTRSLTFIERAGTAPIDIRINERDRRPNDRQINNPNGKPPTITVPQINIILDALLPKISQVRILVVVLENINVLETFMTRFSTAGYPASLERYEIHRSGPPYLWPHGKTNGVGGLIPLSEHPTLKLRWLCLNGLTVDFQRLPLVNLRTIDLRRMTVPACPTSEHWTQMLESSPSLFKLSLDAAGPQWSPTRSAGVRPVELPNLRDLLVGDVSCLFSLWILAHLRAPRVMSLSLMNLTGQDYSQLIDTLTGLFPEVRLLSIFTFEVPKTEDGSRKLSRWFESMPRLKMLKIAAARRELLKSLLVDPRTYWTREELELYAEKQRESGEEGDKVPVLCPELGVLYFQVQQGDDVSKLAEHRKALGVPFKKVYMPDINVPHVAATEVEKIREHVGQFVQIPGFLLTPDEEAIHEEMTSSVSPPPSTARRAVMVDIARH